LQSWILFFIFIFQPEIRISYISSVLYVVSGVNVSTALQCQQIKSVAVAVN